MKPSHSNLNFSHTTLILLIMVKKSTAHKLTASNICLNTRDHIAAHLFYEIVQSLCCNIMLVHFHSKNNNNY